VRTMDEIEKQIKENSTAGKCTPITEHEHMAYFKKENELHGSFVFTFSETVTHAERSVTRSASISVPTNIVCEFDTILQMIKEHVTGEKL
jgi:hypothetical protein